jgi:hypothetical protein
VFSQFRKKLDILISVASFLRKFENVLWIAFLIPSGHDVEGEKTGDGTNSKAYVYLISNIIQLTSKKINIFQVENSV